MQKVLVIDDSQTIRELATTVLSRSGYEVCTVAEGQSGIDLAEAKQPDLVLLDIAMPGLDGFEVLSHMRSRAATTAIPVLMITGSRSEDKVRMALALGAQGYVIKPFNITDLLGRIRRVLNRSAAPRLLARGHHAAP